MAEKVRRVVNSVTDVVFPAPKAVRDAQQQLLLNRGQEYVSNLPLQMLLYFNVLFYPIWLIATLISLEVKIIIIASLIVMTIVETIRLYLGYVGNLTEKVPELAGFWLLTILLQFPLTLFLLLNEATIILPLERAMNIIFTIFVIFEVIIGYFAIRIMVNHQVTKFHLQQFTDIGAVPDLQVPVSLYGETKKDARYTA